MEKGKINLIELGYEWYDEKYDGARDRIANMSYSMINEEIFDECQNEGLVLLDTFGNEIKTFEDLF